MCVLKNQIFLKKIKHNDDVVVEWMKIIFVNDNKTEKSSQQTKNYVRQSFSLSTPLNYSDCLWEIRNCLETESERNRRKKWNDFMKEIKRKEIFRWLINDDDGESFNSSAFINFNEHEKEIACLRYLANLHYKKKPHKHPCDLWLWTHIFLFHKWQFFKP